jgi:hypothetical protein
VTAADRRSSALFRREHRVLLAGVDDVKAVADRLEWASAADARRDLDDVRRFLVDGCCRTSRPRSSTSTHVWRPSALAGIRRSR